MGFDGAEIKRMREAAQQKGAATASTAYTIDCSACKLVGGMGKRKVPRFSTLVRIIGMIIAIPSALGMLVGGITAVHSITGTSSSTGAGVGILFGGGFLMLSAVFGLVGWLLLMRKKAFVCRRCGYMMDRA